MKQIRFTNPLTVGEYPHQFQVNDAHIASISFNAHKGYRDEGGSQPFDCAGIQRWQVGQECRL